MQHQNFSNYHPKEDTMKSQIMNKLAVFFSLILFSFLIPVSSFSEISPEVTSIGINNPKQILFVGNSYFYYNNSLHNHVVRLAKAADPENAKSYNFRSATISGAYLKYHPLESYLKPGALGYDKPFDVVILQGHSASQTTPEKHEAFVNTVKDFDKLIKNSGAKTALYMTHAYSQKHKKYSPDMIEMNRTGYLDAGNQVGALVIPVGLAFQAAYEKKPGIELQQEYDGSHPTKLGTYLAACVVYASLYEQSPVGNTYHGMIPIDAETATFLQTIAWDTVKSFYGR
jgi:hypothetical protein